MTPEISNSLSHPTLQLWAKSDRGKESDAWHPLICHLLDVAASCLEIIELEPPRYGQLLAKDFAMSETEAVALTAALVGLHDLGKANGGFQRKSPSCMARVQEAGFEFPPAQDPEIPHGIVSQALLADLLAKKLPVDFSVAQLLADAVGAHHGFRTSPAEFHKAVRKFRRMTPSWKSAIDELFEVVWQACQAPRALSIETVSAACFQRLMGLTSVADWIGSSLDFAPFEGDENRYLVQARARARVRLAQVGWTRRTSLRDDCSFPAMFQYLAPDGSFQPRGLQKAVVELLDDITAPVLLLVEAPMGEGKTEASFYAHVAIQNAVGHRGAYVGLPSQATGNAMFERLHAFLKAQGREDPPDLQLLHGAQLLNDSYQELVIRTNSPQGEDERDDVTAKAYFTHLKRALLSEYGAGTIDQALLAILGVKHQFVRLWGLGNRTVILDEVHAYDTYTSELLLALVRWLKALGSSVILMSATLPRATRHRLLEAFAGAPLPPSSLPYPRVARVHDDQVAESTFVTRPLASFALRSTPVDLEGMAEEALRLVVSGGCLACIVNTVDRAQNLYELLKGRLGEGELVLFHARFPIAQKQKLEQRVLRLFGKGEDDGRNPARPTRAILVATQVVEQSLDLDFDLMFTDLAPMDLILQRAGRLHRHAKNQGHRRGHEQAALYVAGLAADDVRVAWSETNWEKIYDGPILLRTWLELRQHSHIDLEGHLDPLVQCVYDDAVVLTGQAAFQEFLDEAQTEIANRAAVDQRDARFAEVGSPWGESWTVPPKALHERDAEDPQGPLLTRKTQETVTVVPLYPASDGRHYLDPELSLLVPMAAKLSPALAKAVYSQTIKISRRAVVQGLLKTRQPWTKTPLLQNVYPLILEDGEARFGKTTVTLDPELGLVYQKESAS